jgi:hypothetical protein
MEDPREVGSLSRGVMLPVGATPIRPITGRPSLAPVSFTRCVVRSPYDFPSPSQRPGERDGLTTFRVCHH